MTLRKLGTATGEVTGVENDPDTVAIKVIAASNGPAPAWAVYDEAALLAENGEADQE